MDVCRCLEAATLLGVSVAFLSQLLDTGELVSQGEGDDRRVRVSDVVRYKQPRSVHASCRYVRYPRVIRTVLVDWTGPWLWYGHSSMQEPRR
jgi:hypothetical protein